MRFVLLGLLFLLALTSAVEAQRRRGRGRPDASTEPPQSQPGDQYRDHPRCMEVRAEPVYNGIGWNHVVVLRNGCDRRYDCQVSTNVDPSPSYPVSLAPGEERSVATRNGSPASGFSPKAICR